MHPADQPVNHYRGDNVVIGIPPTPPHLPLFLALLVPQPDTGHPVINIKHFPFYIQTAVKLYDVPIGDVAGGLNQVCTQTTAGLIPQPGIAVATKVNHQVYRHNKWLAQCSKIILNLHFSMPSQMLYVLPSQMLCTLQVKCYVYFQVKCYVLYKSNVMCTLA